ncbi:protein of unknown function [Geodermatophilus siccatus]|uniref:DUF4333 domain-containing protein n=1 Tax=Geodermatophilus siccatus TaxID=1137991 RepID=A0A1G9N643_9ACTN|nr:DUF4333 domain-containing protein [Geodermatophilus siccatus]SDL81315.1 protein of unknown function [Geodermatophilus siccatus]
MTNPPHGGPPPGEPGRPPQPWPPQQWPQQPGPQQPGPWGPPGPYGGQPPYGQPVHGPPSPQYGQPWGGQPAAGQPPYWTGQPPYGQPPYGPPPAPPRRSRRGLVAGIVVPAVLLLLAVVFARLFADTVLDPERVEADVAAQFEEREGVAIDLTCDDEMQVEQGSDYECTGTTADGEEVTLRIVIIDETDASYTWEEV